MTNRFKPLFFICTLLAFYASCSKEDIADSASMLSDVFITAIIEDSADIEQSKTCVDASSNISGVLGLLWQSTDCIGVYSKNGSTRNAKFSSQSYVNAAKADFAGSMFEGDEPWRAYYPYSADNDGVAYNALKGNLPSEQPYSTTTGSLTGDYKYGAPVSGTNKFNFRHLFSLLRVTVDATGTNLAGDNLESIVIHITDPEGNERPINGSFVFNAENGAWGSVTNATGTISMPWKDTPVMSANQTYTGYVTVMPTIYAGDKISVKVNTKKYTASFNATCNVDFKSENVYNIPLKLSAYATNADKFGYEVYARPALNSFSFNVSENSGKLLNNKCVWNSSDKPQFDPVSSHDATILGDNISLMIPYLYDFKLKPTFSVSEGGVVTVNGKTIESGKTEVDFTNPVTFTVTAGEYVRNYTVNITNTGIPVVVLKHSTSGDFSEKQTEGGFLGFGKKTLNKFVNFWVRGKDTDFVKEDVLTVYNANGTIDMTSTCGAKLRGNTSQEYPKKPFAIKLTGDNKILNMPAHKRWVLLANWLDHSMIRNTVAFDIAHTIEKAWREKGLEPGIPWNVHGQNVELVVIDKDGVGHHVGNYFLCEQIKIHGNRLNIQEPYEDVTNPTLETCGYLFEIDNNYDEDYQFKTSNSVPVMFKDAMPDQTIFNAIKSKIQGIEDNLDAGNYSAAYQNLDIYSVIDQLIIWELTMNREYGDPRSVYYFMDGNNKLSAGPVWDFDRGTFQNTAEAKSMGNSDRAKPYNEWMYWRTAENDGDSYIWYRQLAKDATFKKAVQDRWKVIYPYLQGVSDQIRMYGETLKLSFESDSAMWPTDKAAIQEHKSGFSDWSGDEQLPTFEQVINNFVQVYEARLGGMNTLITSGKFTN